MDHGRIRIYRESCYIKETASVDFLTVLLLSFPHSVCIGMRSNFLALGTKLSVPATAVINQLSWHTIKSCFKSHVFAFQANSARR